MEKAWAPASGSAPEEIRPSPLNVIVTSDDFEDGKPEGWIAWSSNDQNCLRETNGCLTVHDYWPGVRGCANCWAKAWRRTPLVNLADGQTLERRVDLVSRSESTTVVNISLCGSNITHGYTLSFEPHGICLSKWMPRWAALACDRTDLPGSNLVLSLALTRVRTDLVISGRVLDREDPQRILFERTVVDTPEVEPTLSLREAQAFTGVTYSEWTKDAPGSPWFTFDYADLEVIQENDGTQPEAAAVFDNFELSRYASAPIPGKGTP